MSSGALIDEPYQQILLRTIPPESVEATIVHELMHAYVGHLSIPTWLNEGLAQFIEVHLATGGQFMADASSAMRARQFWTNDNIQSFWTGASFTAAGEAQIASYFLADTLFRNLLTDHPAKMVEILIRAEPRDAGEAAVRAFCGETLSNRVAQFLGAGNWGPKMDGAPSG